MPTVIKGLSINSLSAIRMHWNNDLSSNVASLNYVVAFKNGVERSEMDLILFLQIHANVNTKQSIDGDIFVLYVSW